MLKTFLRNVMLAGLVATGGVATTSMAAAAAPAPAATAVLFDAAHLKNMKAGEEAIYNFERNGSDQKLLGENFKDTIRVKVDEVADDATRTVSVDVFTADRARPTQHIAGMTGNPLLVVFLDRAISNFASLAGGSRPYLKNRFKQQLATASTVEPVVIDYKGQKIEGYRVKVSPFVGDPSALKMQGYDGSSFEIVVSEKLPGHFAETRAVYSAPTDGSLKLDERTVLDGVGGIQ